MIFDLTAKKLISYEADNSSENLRENFVAFIQGLISFPLDIPGTAYHKCLQVNQNQAKQGIIRAKVLSSNLDSMSLYFIPHLNYNSLCMKRVLEYYFSN